MIDSLIAFLPFLFRGVWVTVSLSLITVVISILFGLLGTTMKLSDNSFLRGAATVYTTLIRAIPELVLMLIIFFGGQILINKIGDLTGFWQMIDINPFFVGSVTIGFIYGSYMTEVFRSAYLSIPRGQIEAAKAFGMEPSIWLRYIVWPQFVPLVLPNFTNIWMVMVKTTALVSIIGLQDLTYTSQQAGKTTGQPFIFLSVAFFVYLFLTIVSDLGLRVLERRYDIGRRTK